MYLIALLFGIYTVGSSVIDGAVVVGGSWATLEKNSFKFWFYISLISIVTALLGYWFLQSIFKHKEDEKPPNEKH
jgi:hypothetical protein